jgi:hypothetical protein
MTKKSTLAIITGIAFILILAGAGCKRTTTNINQATNENTNKSTANLDINAATNSNINTAVKNTNAAHTNDPFKDVRQYDNKIVNFTSTDGKIKGQIGFKLGYDESGKYPMAKTSTFLLINDALPQKKDNNGYSGYYYIGHLSKAGEERSDNNGNVSGAFCNKDKMIDALEAIDNFTTATNIYSDCLGPMGSFDQTTETFFHHFTSYYLLNEFDYNGIVAKNKFSIIDYSPYMVKSTEYEGFTPNLDQATAEGPIERSYEIKYSE